jgi:hypothetical protein
VGCPEISVINYQYKLRIIPEGQRSDFSPLQVVELEHRTQEASIVTRISPFPPSGKAIDPTTHLGLQPRPG